MTGKYAKITAYYGNGCIGGHWNPLMLSAGDCTNVEAGMPIKSILCEPFESYNLTKPYL